MASWPRACSAHRWLRYRFKLGREARFQDGSRITPDIVFTLETLKSNKAHAGYRIALERVLGAEGSRVAPDLVEFRFAPNRAANCHWWRRPVPIFSKAYYATAISMQARSKARSVPAATRLDKVDVGRSITFRRVTDHWAKDLPVSIGQGNFETIRYEYFRDREAAFQAFTPGLSASARSSHRSSGRHATISPP